MLLKQGVYALEDTDVAIEARAADRALVESVLPSAQQKASAALGKDVKISMSNQSVSDDCAGGVIVSTKDGRVKCDQRLEVRLEFLAEKLAPQLRRMLYGNSPGRKYFD